MNIGIPDICFTLTALLAFLTNIRYDVSEPTDLIITTIMKVILRPGVAIPGTEFSVAGLEIRVSSFTSSKLRL